MPDIRTSPRHFSGGLSRLSFGDIWRNRRFRSLIVQTAVLAALFAGGAWLVGNVAANYAALDKSFGFGFLWRLPANYDINQTLIAYDSSNTHLRAAVVGLLNTAAVAAVGIVLATLLGFLVGTLRLSRNWLVSKLAAAYVEITRNTPVLLLILLWYGILINLLPHPRDAIGFGDVAFLSNRGLHLPQAVPAPGWRIVAAIAASASAAAYFTLTRRHRRRHPAVPPPLLRHLILAAIPLAAGILVLGGSATYDVPVLRGFNFAGGITLIPEFVALTWALAFYTSGFIAEIVRAGILSVDRGQGEAARALGLGERQTLTLVVLPQALRVIVPPLTSEYLNLTKNSSLAIAIGYMDLVATLGGITLNQTGREMEAMILVMLVYLCVSLAIAGLMNRYNRRIGPAVR
ncbi:MAG: ABC transporter permease subunit [Rhodospirillaceae bacterium]